MMLQTTTSQSPLQNRHDSLSSSLSYSLYFPSGSRGSASLPRIGNLKYPVVKCSISQVYSYGTEDYERRPMVKWNGIYKRLSLMEDPEKGAASVLNQCEREGKTLSKWELSRIVKELRKFRRYKLALEVYEWMNNRGERFRTTTSDTAIQLDLMAKVLGISSAEDYFWRLPDKLKDKRTYGALLNAYGRVKIREKAESLINDMRIRGYAVHSLPFNVMMTLYMNLKEYDKIDSMVSEMRAKSIPLDLYSYNIWLSSYGSRGSVEEMEEVFKEIQQDRTINPNWTTFSTMASMYIKFGQLGKAEDCLKKVESRITGRDRLPYHYLISLYGNIGNKEEVYRVWSIYKSVFPSITNLGYHTIISSLVRLSDIEGAERMYEEWLSVKSTYDPRIVNLLMGWYVRQGSMEKAEELLDQMAEMGGKPNAASWEILSEGHIREKRVSNALSCLKEAVLSEGSKSWKPKSVNVSSILKLCEQEHDMASKEALIEVLRQAKCLDDEDYMSYIPLTNAVTGEEFPARADRIDDELDDDGDEDGPEMLLTELQGSL